MTMILVETKTLTTAAPSIEFTSVPQDAKDLVILASLRSSSAEDGVFVRFNGNASGYSTTTLYGTGSAGASSVNPYNVTSGLFLATIPGTSWTANTFNNSRFYIHNYTDLINKSTSLSGVGENNATLNYLDLGAGRWSNTDAINSILVYSNSNSNFVVGSTISLYKIVDVVRPAPKATGGSISYADGYTIHSFQNSGTFTPTTDLTNVEYLVIAGGGGGGAQHGGGGGAGGYRSSVVGELSGANSSAEARLSLTSGTNYTVTVGAGGAGSLSTPTNGGASLGISGNNSAFGSITSAGGGVGAVWSNKSATSGGSGGGANTTSAGAPANIPASGTANQGNSGGNGGADYSAGGGGGAGSVGGNAPSGTVAGNGGSGISSSITGTSVARAGGGGGGVYSLTGSGSGGTAVAGGGNGGWAYGSNLTGSAPQNATANTGGGGGGNGTFVTDTGSGGSGIVIVRYAS